MTTTLKQFIVRNNIKIITEYADNNPNMTDSRDMDHWKIKLIMNKKQFSTYFSKGYGHGGKEPTIIEVLECLQVDSTGVYGSFEEFCHEFGYSEDSRKAEKTYNTIIKQKNKLERFFGTKFNEFLESEV